MQTDTEDTIVAIASALGPAARGILRVSGPHVRNLLDACCPAETLSGPDTRQIHTNLTPNSTIGTVPATILFWPTSRSYTHQPSAEFHTLGSTPVLEAIVQWACGHGCRLARPGEFTLRAFLAGRLDLTQAEAVLGVIDARGEQPLRDALRQLAGGISGPLHEMREQLIVTCADLEAGLDFVEEDIEFITADEICRRVDSSRRQLANIARQLTARSEKSERPRIVLWGEPNVGKSSLINAIHQCAAALVSERAGTTRDYVSCIIDVHGIMCELVDTAGVDLHQRGIAGAAQYQTANQIESAELTLLCLDPSRSPTAWELQQLERLRDEPDILPVLTKGDLPSAWNVPGAVQTSSRTGRGMDTLRSEIHRRLADAYGDDGVVSTSLRCASSLDAAERSLSHAHELAIGSHGDELIAAELRTTLDRLADIVGAVYTDDILDHVFSRFCIGK